MLDRILNTIVITGWLIFVLFSLYFVGLWLYIIKL